MEKIFESRNENNPIIRNEYRKDNYHVEICNEKSHTSYVFFSSNGIYYPDTKDNFINKIINEDRYEWQNMAKHPVLRKKAHKIIMMRDIFTSWYVLGISEENNTVEKVAELVKQLAGDDDIITVGSSAGGYMAVLVGILINAKRCICAGPQFDILLYDSNNVLINKYMQSEKHRQFFDITELLMKSELPVYYIFPCRCKVDAAQRDRVKDYRHLKVLNIDSEYHGALPFRAQIPYLLIKSEEQLDKISKRIGEKKYGSKRWLLISEGPFKGAYIIIRSIIYKRKMKING